MRTARVLVHTGAMVAGAVAAVAAGVPDSRIGGIARRTADRLARDVRYATTSAPGVLYRLAGRHPAPDVSDDIIADRIRSSLGPLEKQLDVPRVHVTVHDHVAVLHGEVSACHDRRSIERAARRVSGVRQVDSRLRVGLARGYSRRSAGGDASPPSEALSRLLGGSPRCRRGGSAHGGKCRAASVRRPPPAHRAAPAPRAASCRRSDAAR